MSLSKGELFGLIVRNSYFDWGGGGGWYTNESIGRAAFCINETEAEFDRSLVTNTVVRDNTFTGARGAATVLSRSLRQENSTSEKDAALTQTLGQLQPFIAAFPQECMGHLASFGPT